MDHCLNILKKNDIRDEDKEILREKTERHNDVMSKPNSNQELGWETYCKVLKRIKARGKKMFNPLNKAGREFKTAMYEYMRRIIRK